MNMLVYPMVFGTWEIIAIVLVVLLLFGGKKIPELMKGLGKGVKSFKEGMNEVEKEVSGEPESKSEYNKDEK
ncbi:MAG: twin-arginine translocase TatA/TatE family subunit [Bacteroidales bacterium]|nr:twin-arginine translocase TatA/TatE family subunit [Bacteroidales bacterium]